MTAYDEDPEFDALKPPVRNDALRASRTVSQVLQDVQPPERPTVSSKRREQPAPKAIKNAGATESINSERMSDVGGVDRPVPYDLQAEEAVLGALVIDRDAIISVAPFLRAEDFFRDTHGWIYAAILHLYTRRDPPDPVILRDELEKRGQLEKIGGFAYIVGLINRTPTAAHIVYYARIVQRKATRRKLLSTGGEIAALAYDESVPDEELLTRAGSKLTDVGRGEPAGFRSLADIMDEQFTKDEERTVLEAQGGVVGVYTGLSDLDRWLGAMQSGDLIIPAARPGVGKSALAMCIARNVAKYQHKKVGVISLEMTRPQLLNRLYAVETSIEARRIRSGDLSEEEWTRLVDAQGRMAEWPIFIDDSSSLTIVEIKSHAHRLQVEEGVDLLIVDYLQRVRGTRYTSNRVQEVGEVSQGLKTLARELGIPIIAPAQLSRESERRPNKTPILSDLRESGDIEADADVVMLIHRPEMYEPTAVNANLAEVNIAKSRSGPRELVNLHFDATLTRFGGWAQQGRDYDDGYIPRRSNARGATGDGEGRDSEASTSGVVIDWDKHDAA